MRSLRSVKFTPRDGGIAVVAIGSGREFNKALTYIYSIDRVKTL